MTTKTGIIYLQRDKFHIYSPYLSTILEFRFVPELIHDFDLVNRQLFENLLKVFIANNRIPPSGMIIIISDSASFMKDFVLPPPPVSANSMQPSVPPPPSLEDLQNQANQYLEHIPFELVASKVFPLATGVRAYATNQEIYESLKSILEKQGFIIEAVLPGFIFGPNLSNRPVLDGPSVSAILQKAGTLQGYNLLKGSISVAEPALPGESTGETEEKEAATRQESSLEKAGNKKVLTAVAITAIVLVIVVTGIVIYFQFQSTTPVVPPPPKQVSAPTVTPQISQTVELPDAKELTAQITAPFASASTAASLRSTFILFGFKSVVPLTQEDATLNLLVFSPKVSQQVKTVVTDAVKKVIPAILVQDKPDATIDVTLTLSK